MTSKIGPKEAALRAAREEKPKPSVVAFEKAKAKVEKLVKHEVVGTGEDVSLNIDDSIPKFLQRTETEDEAETRRKKNKPQDETGGLKAVDPFDLSKSATKIRQAIEKDLKEDVTEIPWAEMTGEDLRKKILPKKAKKLPRLLEKAVAQNEERNQTQTNEETQVPKATKKSKPNTGSAKKAVNGSGKKTKVQIVADLLTRKEGLTTADVLKATGWPSVSMPAQAKAAGLRLKKEKDGSVTRYRAS